MLRLLVIVLLLANAGYYAWSQHLLARWGLAPAQEAEGQRLAQQIRPEALHILTEPGATPASNGAPTPAAESAPAPAADAAANSTPGTPSAPTTPAVLASSPTPAARGICLQAGTLDEAQAEAWRRAARALPQSSWQLERSTVQARWMVYMGPFADSDVLAQKRAELKARNVAFDKPGAALEPGLSLGRFASDEAAQRALKTLTNQGVRTARVVEERTETSSYMLRLPLVDAALQTQLDALRPALAGKPLRPCF